MSVIVMTRDEEANIERCLESVTWADEIVVADTGSTDRTVELAHRFTDKVYAMEWHGYAGTRALAVERTSQPWVLWLDADEAVTPELADEIRSVLGDAEDSVPAYKMPRKAFFLGRWIRHCGWYPDYVTRLFRRDRARFGTGVSPHEGLVVDGAVGRLRADLLHHTYPTLALALEKLSRYATILAEEMQTKGRTAGFPDLVVRPAFRFFQMYVLRLGFLDGVHGFVVCVLHSWYVFMKYAKLWEATRARGRRADRC